MADFEYEQLKTLFENLGDRLDRTTGDTATMEELAKVRALVDRSNKQLSRKKTNTSKQDHKEFINEFFDQWKAANPLGTLKGQMGDKKQGTLIDQAKKSQARTGKPFGDDPGGVNKAAKGFGSSIDGMNKKLNQTAGGLDSFMSNLKKGGILAAVGGGSGSALGKAGAAIGERVDAYRDLLTSSEGSVTSIQEMTNAANAAGMSARELADSLLKGSQGARQLGGLKFASLTNALTKATFSVGNLGMTFDKRQEAQQDYLEAMSSSGALQGLNQDQMTRGIIRMVKSSEETAHILGLTRDDAMKAAREQARDHDMNSVLRSKGLDMTAYADIKKIVSETYGEIGARALDQQTSNGALTTSDTATLAATNAEFKSMLDKIAVALPKDGAVTPGQLDRIAAMVKQAGVNNRNDPLTAQMSALSKSGLLNPDVAAAAAARSQAADLATNLKTDGKPNGLANAGTNAYLDGEEVVRRASTVLAATFDALNNSVMNSFGVQLQKAADSAENLSIKLAQGAESTQDHPTAMGTLGVAAVGAAIALPLIGTIFKGMKLAKGAGNLFKLGRGAGAAAGAAQGGTAIGAEAAAAGAAGVGAEGAAVGGMGMMGMAGLTLGGLAAGGLGMYAGNRIINNRKDESLLGTGKDEKGLVGSRSSGYLTSILSGAAGGGLIGSAFGGIGAIPGALLGGAAGLGSAVYSDWDNIWGGKKSPANGSINPATAMTPQNSRRPAANASGPSASQSTPMDQILQRIMSANESSIVFIKKIKENSDEQVTIMRDELSMVRTFNDRLIRLMEENNAYTKMAALNGS